LSTSLPTPEQTPAQTPAQWAVRWHGTALAVALLVPVPVFHLVWHGVLGHDDPPVRTRSQVPAPTPTFAGIVSASPSWMDQKERQLREDSPVAWWLRSGWNEARYRLGAPQSPQVHFGADEWFFLQHAVSPDRAAFDRARPARLRFLGEVRDLVRAAGAELFVNVLPDKERVYADRCYPGGVMPATKRDNYAAILADLGEAGIATVDLAAAMAAARAANPTVELYFRRDSHWQAQGALLAGQVLAAAIEQRFGERLGPKVPARPTGPRAERLIGDLTVLMGIRCVQFPTPRPGRDPIDRSAPLSLLADHLAEVREYYGVELLREGGAAAVDGTDPAAEVLLLGASFAEENGLNALAFGLGRSVRAYIRFGAAGLLPLRDALPELRAGTKARVVVWDVVERGFFTPEWLDPRL
jgi:hypothetical protein